MADRKVRMKTAWISPARSIFAKRIIITNSMYGLTAKNGQAGAIMSGKKATKLDEIEEKLNQLGRAVFGSESFGKVMNTTISTQARLKKGFSDQMGRGLHFYNLPTQDDVTTLAEQCARIEARMVNIESMLHDLVEGRGTPQSKGPSRTRQPKSAARAAPEGTEAPRVKRAPKATTATRTKAGRNQKGT